LDAQVTFKFAFNQRPLSREAIDDFAHRLSSDVESRATAWPAPSLTTRTNSAVEMKETISRVMKA